MSDIPSKNHPYGNGIFRRRIRINSYDLFVEVLLEDDNHGFQLSLKHDLSSVTAIDVQAIRYPYNTCPAAIDKLHGFIGKSLSDLKELSAVAKARQHCTHLFDLLQLAIDYSGKNGTNHQYDIAISDEINNVKKGSISLNGKIIHEWVVSENILISPPILNGQPLMRGFYAWAQKLIPDSQRRAAEALQRGFIVSTSRLINMDKISAQAVDIAIMPIGACHSMQLGVIEGAKRERGVVRDFTDREEMLLRFQ